MTTGFGLSVRDGDWTKVRQNFQHIGSLLLGPTSTPVFDGATLTGNVTVGGNLAVGGNLTTTGYGDFGELRLHTSDYLGWYDNGTRRSFLMANSDSDDLWLWGYDNLGLCSYGPINFTPSGDITDYIRFQTVANVPEITTIGACNLQITASGGSIIVGDNLTIGLAEAGIDYTLTFNGESDNCVLTYDEDNNKLNFGDTAIFTSGTLGAGATTLTGSLSMASYDITCDDIVADGITCNRIKSVDDLNCHIDMTDQTDVIAIEPGYDDGDIGITFKSVDNTAASPQIYPNIFGNYGQLGLSSYRWNKLWVNDIDAVGSLTAGSLITAGNIGIAADTDLLQLASGALTVNGSQLIDGLADVVQLTVKGHSTLTANLQNWTDNADGILASVDAGGNFYSVGGSFQVSATEYVSFDDAGHLDLHAATSIDLNAALQLGGDLTLQQGEIIRNSTDDMIDFVGAGGTTNQTIRFDLDGTYGPVISTPTGARGIRFDSKVGIGNTVAADFRLYVDTDNTDIGAGRVAFGCRARKTTSGTNAQTMEGFRGEIQTYGTGNHTGAVVGMYPQVIHVGTGTVSNMYGLQSLIRNYPGVAGTIDNAYCAYLRAEAQAGTINTAYGLYVTEATGSIGTRYAVYTAGDVPCYFTGAITAKSYTDNTPAFLGESRDALNGILAIRKDAEGKIDHNTLPEFVRGTAIEQRPTGEKRIEILPGDIEIETDITEPVEVPTRNLGAMVTLLTESVKELQSEIDALKAVEITGAKK